MRGPAAGGAGRRRQQPTLTHHAPPHTSPCQTKFRLISKTLELSQVRQILKHVSVGSSVSRQCQTDRTTKRDDRQSRAAMANTEVVCTSCLDVRQPAHPAEHCPYALLRAWGVCVDCLQPDDDEDDTPPFSREYRCECSRPTAERVAQREAELGVASTAPHTDIIDMPPHISPFVGTALRNHPAHRVTEDECPGARLVCWSSTQASWTYR